MGKIISNKFSALFVLALLYLSFVTIGFPQQALGVAWDSMRHEFSKPLESGGILLSIIAFCSAIGSFLIGHLLKKINFVIILIFSMGLMILGLIGYSLYFITFNWYMLALLTIPLGLGAGAINAAVNDYVSKNYSPRHMNWLHGFWGIGATLGPAILTFTITTQNSWRLGYFYLGFLQIILIAVIVLSFKMWSTEKKFKFHTVRWVEVKNIFHKKPMKLLSKAPIISILTFFIYASIETSIGMWSFSVLTKSRAIRPEVAGSIVVLYWGSITAGRFAIGLISNKLGNRTIIKLGMLGALVGLCLLNIHNYYVTLFAMGLTGLCLAGLMPSMVHESHFRFHKNIISIMMGYQVGASLLGGAVLTPIIGFIITRTSLDLLFPIIAVMALIMFILNKILNKLT